MSPLVQLLGKEINHKYLIHLAMGIACMNMAYVKLGLHWSPFMRAYCGVLVLSGAVILAGVALGLCSLAFWTVQSRMFLQGTLQVQEALQHYPAHIFGRWFEIFATVILPYAFANYYPSLLLLGRADQALLPILSWSTPLAALMVMLVGIAIWRTGVRHYKSTGS